MDGIYKEVHRTVSELLDVTSFARVTMHGIHKKLCRPVHEVVFVNQVHRGGSSPGSTRRSMDQSTRWLVWTRLREHVDRILKELHKPVHEVVHVNQVHRTFL